MRSGFHTNSLVWAGENDINRIADFAAETGFDFLEVGPGIELDTASFAEAASKVDFEAFIYCRNFIDDDKALAEKEKAELYRRMDFAGKVGAKRFICSTGISRALSLPASGGCNPLLSLEPAAKFLREAIEHAADCNLQLCLENCPMYRNIATSPLMWRKVFEAVDQLPLYLCYDASHFVWQMIDVYKPFTDFAERIQHVHMKDTWLDREKLDDVGILHNTGTESGFEENQWWRHTVIGEGEIDWPRFMKLLHSLPQGMPALSFEMEDFHYEKEINRVKEGLRLQYRRLMDLESEFTAKA